MNSGEVMFYFRLIVIPISEQSATSEQIFTWDRKSCVTPSQVGTALAAQTAFEAAFTSAFQIIWRNPPASDIIFRR